VWGGWQNGSLPTLTDRAAVSAATAVTLALLAPVEAVYHHSSSLALLSGRETDSPRRCHAAGVFSLACRRAGG
jgi:hypothetical protein